MAPIQFGWESLSPDRQTRFRALTQLWQALVDARALGVDPWQFAVTAHELLADGVTGTDLRWLVAHKLLLHAAEDDRDGLEERCFHSVPDLALGSSSCFVLTEEGFSFVDSGRPFLFPPHPTQEISSLTELPHWDAARRELTWENKLVKRFRTPAPCQEIILAVFQEGGWPGRIDDPLSPNDTDPQQRLHDAVRALNRHQLHKRIRFGRDGTGEGIIWEA